MVELLHGLHPRSSKVVKPMQGHHQEGPRVVNLEVGLHHGCPSSDYRNPGVVELVMVLHYGSPKVVKLEVGLHQGCFIRKQEVSRDGKASDGASASKLQEGEVHDGTSSWESQGV